MKWIFINGADPNCPTCEGTGIKELKLMAGSGPVPMDSQLERCECQDHYDPEHADESQLRRDLPPCPFCKNPPMDCGPAPALSLGRMVGCSARQRECPMAQAFCITEGNWLKRIKPTTTLIYLATPYSHPNAAVRQARFEAVNVAAAELMGQGLHIYSPISHTHHIALAGQLPLGWEYWEKYDRAILAACKEVIVLMLDGWKESKGVTAEIKIATELGLKVCYKEAKA